MRSNNDVKFQRISTRTFIICFFLALTVLISYIAVQNITYTVTIENPSTTQFNSLYQKYQGSLQCPCTTSSIEYDKFISVQPISRHPICSSDFINTSSPWLTIDYPGFQFKTYYVNYFPNNADDFRHVASPFFQAIKALCELAVQTIDAELLTFKSTSFITPKLVSNQQLTLLTNQLISDFIRKSAKLFISTLLFNNNMTHANLLVSAMSTDSLLTPVDDYYYPTIYYNYEYDYDQLDRVYNSSINGTACDCQRTAWCIQPAAIYSSDGNQMLSPIPGKCLFVLL